MQCPNCFSAEKVKNGFIKGIQRYKCKKCGYNYTLSLNITSKKRKKQRYALSMHMEGLSSHAIGKLLDVSHVSVINWIAAYGNNLSKIRNPMPVKIIKKKKTNKYYKQKKKQEFGLLLIETPQNTMISTWNTLPESTHENLSFQKTPTVNTKK